MKTPRQGPTPVGQRNRATTIPAKRHDGPSVDEWEDEGHTCRNCDKPINHPGYCSTLCEDMDKHPAPRDDMERLTAHSFVESLRGTNTNINWED